MNKLVIIAISSLFAFSSAYAADQSANTSTSANSAVSQTQTAQPAKKGWQPDLEAEENARKQRDEFFRQAGLMK